MAAVGGIKRNSCIRVPYFGQSALHAFRAQHLSGLRQWFDAGCKANRTSAVGEGGSATGMRALSS